MKYVWIVFEPVLWNELFERIDSRKWIGLSITRGLINHNIYLRISSLQKNYSQNIIHV